MTDLGTVSKALDEIEFRNDGTAQIPAFGAVEIDIDEIAGEREGRIFFKGVLPTRFGYRPRLFFNGPNPVEPGAFGVCWDGRIVTAAYDPNGGDPRKGEIWGPIEGQSEVRQHVPGGRVLVDARDGKVVLLRYPVPRIWGKLNANLLEGDSAEATFWYVNPETSPGFRLEQTTFTFDVFEVTGGTGTIASGSTIRAEWDEQANEWTLEGWVC